MELTLNVHPLSGDMPKKIQGFHSTQKSDYDYKVFYKLLKGKLTKCRYKMLDRFCRKNSFQSSCGHSYDCCGCVCGQKVSFIHNPATQKTLITISVSYNY